MAIGFPAGFEWDLEKARVNLAKHGIAFNDAVRVFSGFHIDREDDRFDYGERRIITLGLVQGREFVVVFTHRGAVRRILSARRATSHERHQYWQAFRDL